MSQTQIMDLKIFCVEFTKNPTSVCTNCLKGKQFRNPFPKKSTWRASEKIELVHSDICRSITPTSKSRKRYLNSFIDDYTKKNYG